MLIEEKQRKSFDEKVPDPLSPGGSPGTFWSNDLGSNMSGETRRPLRKAEGIVLESLEGSTGTHYGPSHP